MTGEIVLYKKKGKGTSLRYKLSSNIPHEVCGFYQL